ncbi:MAG: chemotaxis protein CheA [Dehalococcoidia bacterium]|jgi:two-component system chemotaxis sensor kinase CheA
MATTKGQRLEFELNDDDLKLFSEEADEQIELLDTSLIQLEREPEQELLQQIFRAAHTVKGSSATIGHKKMASLTHAMETVLDAVRQGRRQPTSDVVDALLAGLDALRILANEVVTRVDSGVETAVLEAGLHAVLEAHAPESEGAGLDSAASGPYVLSQASVDAALQGIAQGSSCYLIEVHIDPECQLPSIRGFQVLQGVDALGAILQTWPERELIESGASGFRVAAALLSRQAADQLQAAVNDVSDIVKVIVRSVAADQLIAPLACSADGRLRTESATPGRPRLALVETLNEPAHGPRKASARSVRIDVERLDGLMNLVGELVIDRTRLQDIGDQLAAIPRDARMTGIIEDFEETTAHLARITGELQEQIMRSRMLSVRSALTRLPRLVRDVAVSCGKMVELFTSGEEAELDRSVIEGISDPLVHLLRNAVDHGIETPEVRRALGKPEAGAVTVTVWNQGTHIYFSVKDDGKGIDTRRLRQKAVERGLLSREVAESASEDEAIQWIFLPGLSTAETLSDVSGRGVGMDIVRNNVERLNGQVTVHSTPGKGSEVIIELPLTLATTILGDGSLGLIVDTASLINETALASA